MQQGNKFINLTGEFGLDKILIHLSKSIVSLSSRVVTNYALQIFLTKKIDFCLYISILVVH